MIEIYHRIVVLLPLKTEIAGEFYICERVSPFNSRVRQQNSSFDNTCYLFCWIDLLEWWWGMLSNCNMRPHFCWHSLDDIKVLLISNYLWSSVRNLILWIYWLDGMAIISNAWQSDSVSFSMQCQLSKSALLEWSGIFYGKK